MFLARWPMVILAGASFYAMADRALATPQVVGDEACGYYDVDMAWFATCVEGRVVRAEGDTMPPIESPTVLRSRTPASAAATGLTVAVNSLPMVLVVTECADNHGSRASRSMPECAPLPIVRGSRPPLDLQSR